MKALVIDDELNGRELLVQMLQQYCTNVKVVGTAADVASGVRQIDRHRPDIVFLDIELPGGDGFSILDRVEHQLFTTIFVTGYEQFAIKAIKYAAFDYLLKPINLEELQQAVERAGQLQNSATKSADKHAAEKHMITHVILPDRKQKTLLPITEICYLKAEGSYVVFYTEKGEEKLSSHSLQYYEKRLPDPPFFRIHKSYLINVQQVKAYDSGRTGYAELRNGMRVPIAARRKATFIRLLD